MQNEILNKDKHYEKAFSELKRNLYKSENNFQKLEYKLSKKEDDLNTISKKNTELCLINSKLQDNFTDIKRKLDVHEKEYKLKVEDSIKLKKNYERLINNVKIYYNM